MHEYLDRLDEAFGAAATAKPKFTAHADPASQWIAARKGPAFIAYFGSFLIETKHGIIMDLDASRSNKTADVGAIRKMLDRTEERFSVKPDWIAAGTVYGSPDNLVWPALQRQILPIIPVFDKGERTDGTFPRADFTWDDETERYICPVGKEMRHTWRTFSDLNRNALSLNARKYGAQKSYGTGCVLKAKCCPNSEARAIHRENSDTVRDLARQCTVSEFNLKAQARRKKVEMLFAHLKRILGLGLLRLRGTCGVQDEFTLAATVLNPRKLAKLGPMLPAAS